MMLPEDVLEKYHRTAKTASKVRDEMKNMTREGMPIFQICETAEGMIRKMGGKPAFPCNVSVNNVAAHYTSLPDDEKVISQGSLVKIDIGVHVDGFIADTAVTICFNAEDEDIVNAAEEALETAIKVIEPRLLTSRLGF